MEGTITDPEVILEALWSQRISYLHVSLLALMVHDWLILLGREVEHVWRTKWSPGKILYIISRYGPFFGVPVTIITQTAPYGAISSDACNTLFKFATWTTFLGISISESVLLLRTNAIYSGSKWVTIPLSVVYVVGFVAGIFVTWLYLRTAVVGLPPNDSFTGCYVLRADTICLFDFLILLVFELVVVILTVWKGLRDFNLGTPLLRVLYRDSISFFLILFGLTLSAILALTLSPHQYGRLMGTSTRVTHSIICCRILLNLRRAVGGEIGLPEVSTGLKFATSPQRQTNQQETVLSEAYNVRGDEENHGGEVAVARRRSVEVK